MSTTAEISPRGHYAPPAIPSLRDALRGVRRNLTAALFDTYRPELHYMRGPGPKWQAKHGMPTMTRKPLAD